ncbi:MAG: PDZ domain-containing protein [Chloroflexota bacterium]
MHRTSYSRVALVALATLALVLPPAAVLGAEEEPLLDQELIAEAIELLRERYVDEEVLTSENLTVGAIRGMVEALGDDGHTQYLTEEEYRIERDVLQGRIAGIGVVLDQRSASPVVVSVVDGSPADRAGLRAGDVIVTVGGVETARMPDGELADRVRGEPDTVVRLGLERPGSAERVVVDVRRGDVEIDPVSWAFAPGCASCSSRSVPAARHARPWRTRWPPGRRASCSTCGAIPAAC